MSIKPTKLHTDSAAYATTTLLMKSLLKASSSKSVRILSIVFLSILLASISKVNAQTVTPNPTQSPAPTPTPDIQNQINEVQLELETLAEKIESPPKDFWDKLDAASGAVSAIFVAVVSSGATYWIQRRRRNAEEAQHSDNLQVAKIQALHNFMPLFQSSKDRDITAAVLAISALGDQDLANRMADLYRDKGGIDALERIANSTNTAAATTAQRSLEAIYSESEERIAKLMEKFNGQIVDGNIFGVEGHMALPTLKSIRRNVIFGNSTARRQYEYDIIFDSVDNETWVVEVKGRIVRSSTLAPIMADRFQRFLTMADDKIDVSRTRMWVAILSPVPEMLKQEFNEKGILISGIQEIEKLAATLE